jgi:hypothetical protein
MARGVVCTTEYIARYCRKVSVAATRDGAPTNRGSFADWSDDLVLKLESLTPELLDLNDGPPPEVPFELLARQGGFTRARC